MWSRSSRAVSAQMGQVLSFLPLPRSTTCGGEVSIDFFHMDALSSAVALKINCDLQLTLMGASLYRTLGARLGGAYATAESRHIFRDFIEASARVTIADDKVLEPDQILHAVRGESSEGGAAGKPPILHALRGESRVSIRPSAETWKPGRLHSNLSWTHYRTLLRVERPEVRGFYELESLKNHWGARELERQINSLLYERLAKSRDKAGLLKLANKGHQIQQPADVFKDPVVIEFLGLPESHKLVESRVEQALVKRGLESERGVEI